ncbi:transporter [Aggregicoccus sp. 17bor-14]|uniref:transporter n=1 Tax=Myxococcaceae TaxID=31 RepID=UPI00129C88E4|nr:MULTISPECIES: transporter [Myxococcaceae]MBF5045279.1 transporter [Simulacricoccus sp. 17bor-14]MRI91020.1 transporter [Aggregicoccus sp. 17bor-14]
MAPLTPLRASLAAALASALLLAPRPAQACAACACGVPSLTVTGEEVPFAGRLRLSGALRGWGLRQGEPGEREQLRELRLDLGVAYSPRDWLTLSAVVPLQGRELRESNLARSRALAPGDMEVSARAVVARDRAFAPRHVLSVLGGVKLPTAPEVHDAEGEPLPLDGQLGTGSFDPFAGLAYSGFRGPFALSASVTGRLPTHGRDGYRGPPALLASVGAQYQPRAQAWALRLGSDVQVAGAGTASGARDASVKGVVAFLSPDVLFSPRQDLLLAAGVRVPVLQHTEEPVRFSPVFTLSLAVDR